MAQFEKCQVKCQLTSFTPGALAELILLLLFYYSQCNSSRDYEKTRVVFQMYENFVEEVDAVDNGISQCDGEVRYSITTTLSARVGHLNPHWNNKNQDTEVSVGQLHFLNRHVQHLMNIQCQSLRGSQTQITSDLTVQWTLFNQVTVMLSPSRTDHRLNLLFPSLLQDVGFFGLLTGCQLKSIIVYVLQIMHYLYLTVSTHSKKVLGSSPRQEGRPLSVESACSPCVSVDLLRVLPQPKGQVD